MMVSVILPTRDRAALLAAAVASVTAQTHGDLELIVVDDASRDGTADLLVSLAEREPRLRVVRHDVPGGAARARNLGARAAEGPVVAFLDDDCTWSPRKLETQLARLHGEHSVVYTRQAFRDHAGRWIVEGRPTPGRPLDALLRTNYVGCPSLMIGRDLFERVGGFDEDLPRLQDWDLVLRLAHHASFAFVPEVLVRGVMTPEGISASSDALGRAARRMVERHAPLLTTPQLAALHYGLGKFLLVDGQARQARDHFQRAARLDPRSPLNWVGLLAGVMGPAPARWVRSLRRARSAAAHGNGRAEAAVEDAQARPSSAGPQG